MDLTTKRKFMTVSDVADFLEISMASAYYHIRQGHIPHRRFGNKILVDLDDLMPKENEKEVKQEKGER